MFRSGKVERSLAEYGTGGAGSGAVMGRARFRSVTAMSRTAKALRGNVGRRWATARLRNVVSGNDEDGRGGMGSIRAGDLGLKVKKHILEKEKARREKAGASTESIGEDD